MNALIYKQDAIDALEARKDKSAKGDIGCFYNTIIQNDIDALKDLPSAQPKTGKWLPDNNNYYEERYICSVCGRSYKVDTCMGKPMWDFCPCGADMRGK